MRLGIWGTWRMTRRLPEGPWDPSKVPRIQILMSQDVFLVGASVVLSPQVEDRVGRSCRQTDGEWQGNHQDQIDDDVDRVHRGMSRFKGKYRAGDHDSDDGRSNEDACRQGRLALGHGRRGHRAISHGASPTHITPSRSDPALTIRETSHDSAGRMVAPQVDPDEVARSLPSVGLLRGPTLGAAMGRPGRFPSAGRSVAAAD